MTRVEHKAFPGRFGDIWIPRFANEHDDFYQAAKAQGLTIDKPPLRGKPFSMVAWDDRPGVLEMRYEEELIRLPPPEPEPEPTMREQILDAVEHAMWEALHAYADELPMGPYISEEDQMIDATGSGISLRPAAIAAMTTIDTHLATAINKALNA